MIVSLFDREDERESIDRFQRTVVEQETGPRVLWLEGASGVGKSRLLRHACDNLKQPLLKDENERSIYKCDSGHIQISFAYPSELLTRFFAENPRRSESILFSAIQNEFSHTTIVESLAVSIPAVAQFKWAKEALSRPLMKTTQARELMDEALVRRRLRIVYASVLAQALTPYFCEGRLFLAIDDIQWLDRESVDTLISLARRLAENGLTLGYMLASRDYHSTTSKENYEHIEASFRQLDSNLHKIRISPLEPRLAGQFLRRHFKHLSRGALQRLAKQVDGNFYELTSLIQYRDHEISKLLESSLVQSHSSEPFAPGKQLIADCVKSEPLGLCVLGTIALLELSIDVALLEHVVRRINREYLDELIGSAEIRDVIESLEAVNLVRRGNGQVGLGHDRMLDPIIELLMAEGLYQPAMKILAHIVIEDALSQRLYFDIRYLARSIELCGMCGTLDAKQWIQLSDNLFPKYARNRALISAMATSSKCLNDSRHLPLLAHLFELLVLGTQYSAADALGQRIYHQLNTDSGINAPRFLQYYAIALRELGVFQRNNAPDAKTVAERACNFSPQKASEQAQAMLLYASILEHFREHEKIKGLYQQIGALLKEVVDPHERAQVEVRYLRNHGLIQDHETLEATYQNALQVCNTLDSNTDSASILQATVRNNLGLSFARRGLLKEAIVEFEAASKTLLAHELEPHSPLCNLAVCHALAKDYELAQQLLSRAKTIPGAGPYRAMSIEVNLSIVEWFLGFQKEAQSRLLAFIEGNAQGNIVFDRELSQRSRMTYGYFLMKQGKFAEAAFQYLQSLDVEYRLAVAQERFRRNFMKDYCLIRAGLSNEGIDLGEVTNIDLEDEGTIPTHKPYDFQFLALYVF